MRLGATLVHLSDAPPFAIARWAEELVAAGFESLWAPEIIGRGPLVPDPFVALAVAAGVTRDVELGTATVQVPLHHPAELAHRVLSLVAVCGDRLTLGVSPGSTATDYAALDRDYSTRFAAFRRDAGRLRELLVHGGDERAELDRDAVPERAPTLLLGSWGANVERAAREFDGWLASGYRTTPDQIVAAHEVYRRAGGTRAIVCAVPVQRREDLDAAGEALRRYAAAGFDDAVVLLAPGGPDPAEVRALLPLDRPVDPPRRYGGSMRLFHLIDPEAWTAATSEGQYRPDSLTAEGFVHLSFAEQVAGSANRHYADADRLVAVEFDAADLPDDLRVEDSYGSGTAFPHLYAPVPTAAARAVHPMRRETGAWVFSPDAAGAAASPGR